MAVPIISESFFELSDGTMKLPARWEKLVNNEDNRKNLKGLDNSIKRGAPFGHLYLTRKKNM